MNFSLHRRSSKITFFNQVLFSNNSSGFSIKVAIAIVLNRDVVVAGDVLTPVTRDVGIEGKLTQFYRTTCFDTINTISHLEILEIHEQKIRKMFSVTVISV